MVFVPIHDAHAIDKVTATLVLGGAPVTANHWLPILESVTKLGRELEFPDFHELLAASFSMDQAPETAPQARTQVQSAGIGFRRLGANGLPLLGFAILRNELRVDSHAYVRWAGFQDLALRIFRSVLPAFPAHVAVSNVRLEYWDRFVNRQQRLPWTDVFRTDGRLPKWFAEGTANWHAYLGWFDEQLPYRRLVNVHVDTLDHPQPDGGVWQTANLYTLTASAGEPMPLNLAIDSIEPMLDELHNLSKQSVQSLLSDSMQERISLFPREDTNR